VISSATHQGRRQAWSPSEASRVMTIGAGVEGSATLRNFFQRETAAGRVFRWSEPVATIDLRLPQDDYLVRLDTAALRGCVSRLPLAIFWNDEQIAAHDVVASGAEVWFRVARHRCLKGWSQRLMLVVEPLAAAPPDSRQLGLPLVDVQVFAGALPALPDGGNTAVRRLFGRRRKPLQSPAPHLPTWAIKGMRKLHGPDASWSPACSAPTPASAEADDTAPEPPPRVACDAVIVAPDEINSRHGTGVLLQYMFPDLRDMAVVQSSSFHAGDPAPTAVTWKPPAGLSRMDTYRHVHGWFHHSPPSRAYVVPYNPADLQVALALRHLFGTRLVLHVMDDNTLVGQGIPGDLMAEAIANSEVRFAISPEMRAMYEQRFGRKFHLLPPVVARGLVELPFARQEPTTERGVVIGNVWSAEWIDHMVRTVRDSGVELDWFCNNPKNPWVADNRRALAEAGIFLREPLWGETFVRELRRRPFLVLPTDRSGRAVAQLSLPSRVVFHAAAIRTPILVLGDESTAVARFVERFELGGAAPYESQAFRNAVAGLTDADTGRRIRATCDRLAPHFAAGDIERWIWDSMEVGRPADERFESLWPPENALADYVPPDPPQGMDWPQHAAWQMLARYARHGGRPRTILDVGASTGRWSHMAANVFSESHFVLCEPLFGRYPAQETGYYLAGLPSHEVIEKVVTNTCGQASILVSDSLYGSSLLAVDDVHGAAHRVGVECVTIDKLDEMRNWDGPIFLKADVQFAEHLVMEGAANLLRTKIDAVFLELSFVRGHEQAKTYAEMCSLMDGLGFELFDEAEGWRDPCSGKLEQKDVLFISKKRGAGPGRRHR